MDNSKIQQLMKEITDKKAKLEELRDKPNELKFVLKMLVYLLKELYDLVRDEKHLKEALAYLAELIKKEPTRRYVFEAGTFCALLGQTQKAAHCLSYAKTLNAPTDSLEKAMCDNFEADITLATELDFSLETVQFKDLDHFLKTCF